MADVEISSLHFDSKSIISYPPSIVMKESHPSSTAPITPIPKLFTPTLSNIGSIRPRPEPYPPTMHHATNIVVQRFRFRHPHPHMPHNIWHVVIRPTQPLHCGMRVNIRGYGVVDIWGLPRHLSSEWVVYQCTELEDRETFDMHCHWSGLGGMVNLEHGMDIFCIGMERFSSVVVWSCASRTSHLDMGVM
jgi:hypothetical protein